MSAIGRSRIRSARTAPVVRRAFGWIFFRGLRLPAHCLGVARREHFGRRIEADVLGEEPSDIARTLSVSGYAGCVERSGCPISSFSEIVARTLSPTCVRNSVRTSENTMSIRKLMQAPSQAKK
jgi:hypothetical protein